MTQPAATRNSWKILPLPETRESLRLDTMYRDADFERMAIGHIPRDMDDKWFVFCENGWLYFHRSWTGACIYALRFQGSPDGGYRVIDGWVSRDTDHYSSPGLEFDRRFVQELIQSRLLA